MNKRIANILKFLFFLSIGCLLVWLAIKDKSDEELSNIKIALLHADYFWITFSLIISAFSHLFRAFRWKLLLEPLGHKPKTSNTFFSLMVGYLANFALPRLGEVSRCGLLNKYEKIPFTESFGTVISERALDLICMVLVFFITLGVEFDKIIGIANDLIFSRISNKMNGLNENKTLLILVILSVLLVSGIIYYLRKKIKQVFGEKVKGLIKGLIDGLKSIKNIKQPKMFFVYTILIWLMYILQIFVCFYAFQETQSLTFIVAMVIVVFGGLGIILVPGGTGAYQAIVIQILTTVYFISETNSFAFAWAVWTSQFVIILFLGLLSLILLPLLNKESRKTL